MRFAIIDVVGAGDELSGGGDAAGEVPGDEAGGFVVVCLREGVPQRGLRAKVHVAEQQLARQAGRRGCVRPLLLLRQIDGVLGGPVNGTYGEGAKVVVRGQEGGAPGVEGGWSGFGLGEGGGVGCV